jgi:adenylate kinase
MNKRLIVLGAPGAGKGTQARNLAAHYGALHVSTGELLREHVKNNTLVGESIQHLIETGRLVPDELVLGLIIKKILSGNYVLDGYPRNLRQAETLHEICVKLGEQINGVVLVDVPDDVIVSRISGRLVCPECGAMYHYVYYPSSKGLDCDKCSGRLETRKDDKAATVKDRLAVYHEMTSPVINFYKEKGMLETIDGTGAMLDITKKITDLLDTV